MITWMKHGKHGRMPCYDVGEVERAKSHGWVVDTEYPPRKPVAPAGETAQNPVEPNVAEPTAEPVTGNSQAPRKRGRPPSVTRDGNSTDSDQ